jgi:hypothetical protein
MADRIKWHGKSKLNMPGAVCLRMANRCIIGDICRETLANSQAARKAAEKDQEKCGNT